MAIQIRRAGVIGAGVMGSGIAAHLANAGIEVVLLDIVPPNLTDAEKKNPANRNKFAAGGLEKAIKGKPAAFFHKGNARLVSIGNIEDNLDKLSSCDLVIEAIIEQMDAKRALFAKLEATLPAHAIVASNTSGLRISEMMQGRSEAFKKRFLVMHFFNPVRYMKLLELVSGPDTDQGTVAQIQPHRHPRDARGHSSNARGRAAAGRRGQHHRRADGTPEVGELSHRRSGRPRHARARHQELLRFAGR